MTGLVQGKVGIITGAGRGIGQATALAFAREGGTVVAADVTKEALAETSALLAADGFETLTLAADVTDAAQVQRLVDAAVAEFGRLDCAHNNAATHSAGAPTAEFPVTEWHRVLEVNLTSVFLCMQAEIPAMLRAGAGAIVNTCSTAGVVGVPNMPAYVASKHGVAGLTKVAALDYAPQGIRVNAVCPGWTETPMVTMALGEDVDARRQARAAAPVDRLAAPNEIAEAVVWLCSDRASFTTGSIMCVDGGYTAW